MPGRAFWTVLAVLDGGLTLALLALFVQTGDWVLLFAAGFPLAGAGVFLYQRLRAP